MKVYRQIHNNNKQKTISYKNTIFSKIVENELIMIEYRENMREMEENESKDIFEGKENM
jgi:hypothetical protein